MVVMMDVKIDWREKKITAANPMVDHHFSNPFTTVKKASMSSAQQGSIMYVTIHDTYLQKQESVNTEDAR
jgi:hypothetical protein